MLAEREKQKPVRVSVRKLLRFFDEAPLESKGHATAVAGVLGEDLGAGLLKHCLERLHHAKVDILLRTDGRPVAVGTGHRKGKRLDRWIRVVWPDGRVTLFQAEIKSWSAHAIGGRRIKATASPRDLSEYARRVWKLQMEHIGGPLNNINKVLVPMAPPSGQTEAQIAPLLIFWLVIQNRGKTDECFFRHVLKRDQRLKGYRQAFDRLAIFSMSLYLRHLLAHGKTEVRLEMPNCVRRMQWLNAILRA